MANYDDANKYRDPQCTDTDPEVDQLERALRQRTQEGRPMPHSIAMAYRFTIAQKKQRGKTSP